MEKLVLIDGNSLINRAFYAMPPLSTKDGTPTNAVYGFLNMFIKMLSDIKPKYVACAFDVHAPTFRHEMYSEYKATRKPMPEDLRPQIPLLKEVLKLMGVCVIEKAGLEADDIIGTIAKSTKVQTIIYTGDRDSFQLVDDETSVYFTKRGISDIDVLNAQNFTEKTQIEPYQVIELKSLMGDASDNIPGVKGVGEKTAVSLVQTYKTLDGVYSHIDEIKGSLKEKLEQNKETAYLSHKLATIDTACDVNTNLNDMLIKSVFPINVKNKFIELEFKSLYKREDIFEEETQENRVEKNNIQVITVVNLSDLPKTENEVALVLTSASVNVYFGGEKEYKIPLSVSLFEQGFSLTEVLPVIKSLINLRLVVLYDKKAFRHFIYDNLGENIELKAQDVSLLKYLCDFSGNSETLTEVIDYYGLDNSAPAYSLYEIYKTLTQKLNEYEMQKLYNEIELPLSDVLFSMEIAGFKVDVNAVNETQKKYQVILSDLEREILEIAGEKDLNVNSPKQLGELLFEKLKIGKGKKTKSGYSTSADVLENFEDAHPIVPLILKYRKIQKLQSTYVEGFKPLIDKTTGLIHTSFNQTVTSTGRLSSKEPNLQNIPVRDEEGKYLRKFFVPKSDKNVLIDADYSQIELRLLADFSNCKKLIDAFNEGEDIHKQTASNVFGVPLDKVDSKMRRDAKAVNFGIIYGISEYGLAKNIGVSSLQAKEYISSYFAKYPEIKSYIENNVSFANKTGYAVTIFNRRRYIRELNSPNFNMRAFGNRVAMNMPLQGSAADIIKIAMINVFNRLKKENLKTQLILQVHDELILDSPIEESERAQKILVEEMENAVKLKVKLTVEAGIGSNWFDLK